MDSDSQDHIAIIGLSGRFPGAKNSNEFWENLKDGVESITHFSDEDLKESGIAEELINNPNYVKSKGIIKDADHFDADFFDIKSKEAKTMDPQQRIFLECSWEAIEDAGYDPECYSGQVGLYGGVGFNHHLYGSLEENESFFDFYSKMLGNSNDFVTTRVSYKLNLRGPSINVQTACSTGLTAVHMACQSLLNFESDMVLAGGVSVSLPIKSGFLYSEDFIVSPDGHTRTFDVKAKGTIFSHGAGMVLLKRLGDAKNDQDHIYAVIKGSAVNNDGSQKLGFTAPSLQAQSEVIKLALENSGEISPETISYIEAHGTATSLGDVIEIKALTDAYREFTDQENFCAIGSVKTNFGHTDSAAGIIGLIKTVMCLKNKELVPSLHFNEPNPDLKLNKSPFYVNTEHKAWKKDLHPRRAGVSAFGIGGTNAHVILEEYEQQSTEKSQKKYHIIPLSGKSLPSLSDRVIDLLDYMKKNPIISWADVAFTLQQGRREMGYRKSFVYESSSQLRKELEKSKDQNIDKQANHLNDIKNIVFVFSKENSKAFEMYEELYEQENIFQQSVDLCFKYIRDYFKVSIKSIEDFERFKHNNKKCLTSDQFKSLSLFIIELSLAKLYVHFGVIPERMIGKGIGVYTASCATGSITQEEGFQKCLEMNFDSDLSQDNNFEIEACKKNLYLKIGYESKDSPAINFYKSLASLWQCGATLKWELFYDGEKRQKLSLPTYPFQRKGYLERISTNKVEKKSILRTVIQENMELSSHHPQGIKHGIEKSIICAWKNILGKTPNLSDNFFDSGGNSMLALEFIDQLEKICSVKLHLSDILEYSTIKQLFELVKGKQENHRSIVINIQQFGEYPPLFCVHPAGGSAIFYRNLSEYLGKNQPIYGIQTPSLIGEQEFSTLLDRAKYYIEMIRQVQFKGPYFLIGQSYGGNICVEMATQLKEQGEEVALVGLFDSFPDVSYKNHTQNGTLLLSSLVYILDEIFMIHGNKKIFSLNKLFEQLKGLSEVNQWEYITSKSKELVNFKDYFPRWKNNLKELISHKQRVYPGALTLFQANEKFPEVLAKHLKINVDTNIVLERWTQLSSEPFERIVVPGNHFTLFDEPNIASSAGFLRCYLSKCRTKS
ncbi:MAG: hypothetical protein HRT90_01105 [Candidatus Margulisbacteria bacterium]|nr:hypothetical protein [Candidatus Margulisiibacteriota bacterium]